VKQQVTKVSPMKPTLEGTQPLWGPSALMLQAQNPSKTKGVEHHENSNSGGDIQKLA